ncbi:hypothetical protein RHE_CH00137 [Rhizobium etli CFN 42]|uniref:Uncharacterized protein n=1 Tax=Rhizobium etli (strain ATCC 51251 / DSM 11541 / JCM 21823 / NBRC 15573 / CFN 42) TaxID=347834 RepID=Q2KDX4_RHIEC|nr:hypothetical protein RHE_CH00137 [Rhizobium etli CFN 42]
MVQPGNVKARTACRPDLPANSSKRKPPCAAKS